MENGLERTSRGVGRPVRLLPKSREEKMVTGTQVVGMEIKVSI